MTFPHKTNSHRTYGAAKGFTLLEIIIVLGISALIIGGGIAALVVNSSERILRNASGDIELLAKKAHTAAILHQTSYIIEFKKSSVKLSPLADTTVSTSDSLSEPSGTDQTSPLQFLNEEIKFDPDIELSILHWNEKNYISAAKKNIPTWYFNPNGLSEPITVKLTLGNSYAKDTYHPLTATITDSELEAN